VPSTYSVLSPHLDDAVLSCALFVNAHPGSRIVTVFADGPASVRPLPAWDRATRFFAEGSDVMAVRREEDKKAASVLRASAEHLPFWDSQYRNEQYGYRGPEGDELVEAIVGHILGHAPNWHHSPWLIPLGLGHRDHRLVAEVGLRLTAHLPGGWHLYEDLPYALENRDDVQRRKLELQRRGFALGRDDDVPAEADRAIKKAAIACHASQRRTLRRRARAATRAQERLWVLVARLRSVV
jgi:LmbE family N-acetylglucosaminyl deacetylase